MIFLKRYLKPFFNIVCYPHLNVGDFFYIFETRKPQDIEVKFIYIYTYVYTNRLEK